MTEQEKKQYNKEHYIKNKPVILDRMKSRYKAKKRNSENVVQLFSSGKTQAGSIQTITQEQESNPRLKALLGFFRIGTLFLIVLAIANTYFLVNELARYFASVDSGGTSGIELQRTAYLKALLLEGSVISLCVMIKVKGVSGKLLRNLVILSIYSFSIWVTSSLAIQNAFLSQAQVNFYQTRVTELESEVTKKTALRDSYFQSDRVTLGTKIDSNLQESKTKLDSIREGLVKSPDVRMIWNTLISLILFRLLIMVSNLLCLRELGKRCRLKLKIT
jgi:hypothetical protein